GRPAQASRAAQSAEKWPSLRRRERGPPVVPRPLREALEQRPGAVQVIECAAVAAIRAQPGLELAPLFGRESARVDPPRPNRCLVVDLCLRLQSDDVAHLDSRSLTRRCGNVSSGAASS